MKSSANLSVKFNISKQAVDLPHSARFTFESFQDRKLTTEARTENRLVFVAKDRRVAEIAWVATKAERGEMVSKDTAAMRLEVMEAIVRRRLAVNENGCILLSLAGCMLLLNSVT